MCVHIIKALKRIDYAKLLRVQAIAYLHTCMYVVQMQCVLNYIITAQLCQKVNTLDRGRSLEL